MNPCTQTSSPALATGKSSFAAWTSVLPNRSNDDRLKKFIWYSILILLILCGVLTLQNGSLCFKNRCDVLRTLLVKDLSYVPKSHKLQAKSVRRSVYLMLSEKPFHRKSGDDANCRIVLKGRKRVGYYFHFIPPFHIRIFHPSTFSFE